MSPRDPSAATRCPRSTPSAVAPSRRIAAVLLALRASARSATRCIPHPSKAWVSSASLQAGLVTPPHHGRPYQVLPISQRCWAGTTS